MSETMDRNLVFPENDRPVRLLLTRSALGGHEELATCEDPWVRHKDYRPGDLRGKHMLTGIMADRTNYSDCISVSFSAAQKLACYRRKSQTIVDTHPVDLQVRVGSSVSPGDVVAVIDEGVCDGKQKLREVKTHKLVTKAKVVDIVRTETHVLGEPAERIRIRYECMYTLSDGDKMTTRHGNKGVVRIVADKEMPKILVKRYRISLAAVRSLWYSVHNLTTRDTDDENMQDSGMQHESPREQDLMCSTQSKKAQGSTDGSCTNQSSKGDENVLYSPRMQEPSVVEWSMRDASLKTAERNPAGIPAAEENSVSGPRLHQREPSRMDVPCTFREGQKVNEELHDQDPSSSGTNSDTVLLHKVLNQDEAGKPSGLCPEKVPSSDGKPVCKLQVQGSKAPAGSSDHSRGKVCEEQLRSTVCQLSHLGQGISRGVQQSGTKELDQEAYEPIGLENTTCRSQKREHPPEDPAELARQVPDILYEEGKFWQLNWVAAEILINPFSFVSRRPYGALREMVVNELATREGKPIETDHFSQQHSTAELHAAGLDRKFPARIGGVQLPFRVFFGWLYWMRLEHHACEKLSATGSAKPLNFHGLNPDAGKISGQRLNLNVATVMHAKNLVKTHELLHRSNVERGAVRMIEDLMSVLTFTGQSSAKARREGRV
jgi:hypothetical protein